MIPILIIRSEKNSIVNIIRGEHIDNRTWASVVFWWLDDRNINKQQINIPVENFLDKRIWLRSSWMKDGGEIDIDDSTRTLLSSAIEDFDLFRSLMAGESINSKIEIGESDLKRHLTKFQRKDAERLLSLPSGANFSVPGAGKTTTTLVVWRALKRANVLDRLLVICPRSAFESWMAEPSEVFHEPIKVALLDDLPFEPSIDILVLNYEKLENQKRLDRVKTWINGGSAMLVLDEAHRVKGGANSIRWRRCKEISRIAKRIDLLTGTPMPQGFDDLRNLFALTWPIVPRSFLSDLVLSNMRRGSIFVRTTKDELGLPPVDIHAHTLEMGKQQAEIYSALRKAYVGAFRLSYAEDSYFGSRGRAVMTLIAAASNPGLLAGIYKEDAYLGLEWPPKDFRLSDSLMAVVNNYASIEMPPKYKWIREFCQKAFHEGRKVLVWTNLIGNIRALTRLLEPLQPAVIYGAISQEERQLELKRFRTDPNCSVLISNPQTLGEGVSLHHECHDAIYLDRSYNAGQYLQSLDRIHRLGLPSHQKTTIHILISKFSIDQKIAPRLEHKIEMLSMALNDAGLIKSSLPDEDAIVPNDVLGIDQYDLDELFSHLESNER